MLAAECRKPVKRVGMPCKDYLYSTYAVANKFFGGDQVETSNLAEIGLVVVQLKFCCRAISTPRSPHPVCEAALAVDTVLRRQARRVIAKKVKGA